MDSVTERLFVLDEQRDVRVMDLHNRTVVATLTTGRSAGIALDPSLRHLFVSVAGGIMVFDVDSLSPVTTIALPGANQMAVDAVAGRLWVTRGDQVSEIDAASFMVLRSIPVYATALALDEVRRRVLVLHSGFPTLTMLEAGSGAILWTAQVERTPVAVTVNSATGEAYVANRASHTVSVVGLDGTVIDAIPMRGYPDSLAFDPALGRLYVSTSVGGFAIVDPVARAVVERVAAGIGPRGIAVDSAAGTVLVANDISHDISVYRDVSATLDWPAPTPIVYGVPLGSAQLRATARVAGSFTYAPPAGTVLGAGVHTLDVAFNPADNVTFLPPVATASLTVLKGDPVLRWPTPATIVAGTALGAEQLNATASVAGSFVYNPPAGTILAPGAAQTLSVTFTPADGANFNQVSASVSIDVSSPPLTVAVASPNGGEKLFTGSAFTIQWTAAGGVGGPGRFDVAVSTNGGATYSNIAACVGLAGSVRSCVWAAPGPVSTAARIRVTTRDTAGNTAADASDADVTLATGAPAITVTSPNTAVSWTAGSVHAITWNHNLGAAALMRIDVSRDNGASWEIVSDAVPNTTATSGTYPWTVSGPASTAGLVRVVWTAGTARDVSNAPFTIAPRTITITAPNTAVTWRVATTQRITFTHNLGIGQEVIVWMTRGGGPPWFPIGTMTTTAAASGTFSWSVSGPPTAQARVRVSSASTSGAAVDESDTDFAIVNPTITVTAPNTAVAWRAGSVHNITFTHNMGVGQVVDIELSRDGGSTWSPITSVTTTAATSGSVPWIVSGPPTSQALIRAAWAVDRTVIDVGGSTFTISPRIALTVPNTAVTWGAGTTRTITWSHNLPAADTVDIDLSPDSGSTWIQVARGVANATAMTGTYSGSMPPVVTTRALIRVSQSSDPSAFGVSAVPFTLAVPAVTVTAPNTNVNWAVGSVHNLTWTHNLGTQESISLEISRDGGTTWEIITSAAPNATSTSGAFSWTVTGPSTTAGRLRARWTASPGVQDFSNVNFRIQ